MPFRVNVVAPVPPLATPMVPALRTPLVDWTTPVPSPLTVKPVKVGEAPVPMFWTVFTTPPEALKLLLLKVAMPLVVPSAAASFKVIVLPAVEALATVKAPVSVFSDVTPLPPAAKLQLLAGALKQTVPL